MSRTTSYELPEYLAERRAARRGERAVQVTCLVIAAAALACAALLIGPMNKVRLEQQMVIDPDTIKGLPPIETLLAKTATLRALAIDVAFIRSERLKEEGKYYEAMQLADWICRLAPRFPTIWAFQAWNQAYNISVATYTAEERWKWVSNGIRLLRDQGIQYNPKSVGLYKELAWLYWHKIGEFNDDQHWNYKKEVAIEVERILGPPPVVLEVEEVVEAIRRIARAPRNLNHLLEADAEAAELVRRLAAVDLAPDENLLAFLARYVRDDIAVARYLKSADQEEAESLQARRVALLSESATAGARQRLVATVRARVLRERFKLDPDWMLSLMEHYGPIDWRSPFAHSLYWASYGDMVTRGQLNLNMNDSMNTARYVFSSLKFMVEKGRMVLIPDFDRPNRSFIDLLPDPRFIDPLHHAYLEISKAQFEGTPYYREGESAGNYRVGHFNFLADAIKALYLAGDRQSLEKAQFYYDYLRRVNREEDGGAKEMYMQPLRDFVLGDLTDEIEGVRRATVYVGGLLRRSFNELALGQAEASVASAERAADIHQHYMTKTVEGAGDRSDRRRLDKLVVMRRDAVIEYLGDPSVPMLHKARVWAALDLPTRQMAWDEVQPALAELCSRQDPPWDLGKVFSEPPGMAEYRANPVVEIRREEGEHDEGTKDVAPEYGLPPKRPR